MAAPRGSDHFNFAEILRLRATRSAQDDSVN